jgi:hypothetical protein
VLKKGYLLRQISFFYVCFGSRGCDFKVLRLAWCALLFALVFIALILLGKFIFADL